MELLIKLIGAGLVSALLALSLRKTNPDLALQVSLGAGILLFSMTLGVLRDSLRRVTDFASRFPQVYESVGVVLKIVGIAYLAEFAIQILRDGGEGAIASKVELGGKLAILAVTLPLVTQFAETVLSLLP